MRNDNDLSMTQNVETIPTVERSVVVPAERSFLDPMRFSTTACSETRIRASESR